MKQCILHIGMPKTGTSSLQESLYYGLADPAFRYIGFGGSNGTTAFATLFGEQETHYSHRIMGRSAHQVRQYRMQWLSQLDNTLLHTGADVRPILSAEVCWGMNRMELERIRDFMGERGCTVQIVAYIRPWKQWLESSFQQRIKLGQNSFQVAPRQAARLDYRGCIETLASVFGAEQVQVFKYDPGLFPEGCVVRHFCQHLGIHLDPASIRRANDSLSLPAVQLLYAYRKFGPGYGAGATAMAENGRLHRRLSELGGPGFHFHSAAVEPVISALLPQLPWLEQRVGASLAEELTRYDNDICVRTESDLFDFDGKALAWLAAAVHSKPVSPATGEAAARAVAAQMHRLRQLRPRLPARVKARRLVRAVGQRLRHWRVWVGQ